MKTSNISSQRYRKMGTGFMGSGIVAAVIGIMMLIIVLIADIIETPLLASIAACLTTGGVVALLIGVSFLSKAKTAPSEDEISRRRRDAGDKRVTKLIEPEIKIEGAVFSVKGYRGRNLYVFENKCVIQTVKGLDSLTTGNYTDGEKQFITAML